MLALQLSFSANWLCQRHWQNAFAEKCICKMATLLDLGRGKKAFLLSAASKNLPHHLSVPFPPRDLLLSLPATIPLADTVPVKTGLFAGLLVLSSVS